MWEWEPIQVGLGVRRGAADGGGSTIRDKAFLAPTVPLPHRSSATFHQTTSESQENQVSYFTLLSFPTFWYEAKVQ